MFWTLRRSFCFLWIVIRLRSSRGKWLLLASSLITFNFSFLARWPFYCLVICNRQTRVLISMQPFVPIQALWARSLTSIYFSHKLLVVWIQNIIVKGFFPWLHNLSVGVISRCKSLLLNFFAAHRSCRHCLVWQKHVCNCESRDKFAQMGFVVCCTFNT